MVQCVRLHRQRRPTHYHTRPPPHGTRKKKGTWQGRWGVVRKDGELGENGSWEEDGELGEENLKLGMDAELEKRMGSWGKGWRAGREDGELWEEKRGAGKQVE